MEHSARRAEQPREVDLIRELREELDLRGTLERMGRRADWDETADRFQAAQEELGRFEVHRASMHELDRRARSKLERRREHERLHRR